MLQPRAVLGRITEGAAHVKIISVPAARALYSVAVGPRGDIWTVDVPRCSRHRCYRARIIEYDPRAGTFVSHVLPSPRHAGKNAYGESAFFGMSPTIQVAPDGTVWIQQILPPYTKHFPVTLLAMRRGRFSQFTVPESYLTPLFDRRGDVWLQPRSRGSLLVIDAKTGVQTFISEPPDGTLLQDPHGVMWWVEGP